MQKKQKILIRLIIHILLNLTIIAVMLTIVLRLHYYNDNNMFPVLPRGSLLIAYRLEAPVRNDVVIYNADGNVRVGRIIAVENDEVDISDSGEVLINGIPSNENMFYPTEKSDVSDMTYPHNVEKNSFFILNDYRLDTNDSRQIGDVDKRSVIGAVILHIGKSM